MTYKYKISVEKIGESDHLGGLGIILKCITDKWDSVVCFELARNIV
jgi:hypothetical protein